MSAIDIDHIRNALEGEEGDADRQDHRHERQIALEPRRIENAGKRGQEKSVIFEEAENGEAACNRDADNRLAEKDVRCARQRQAGGIIDEGREKQQAEEAPVPPAIEKIACRQQYEFADFRPSAHSPAGREHDQKEYAELNGRKKHTAPPSAQMSPKLAIRGA